MSDADAPNWDWVKGLEVDYLPDEVKSIVRHVGALIYLYGLSIDAGSKLWDDIRITALENRVSGIEIKLRDLQRNNSTTLAELLSKLVFDAALSTGLGLLATGIASGIAGLAKSATKWHTGMSNAIKNNQSAGVKVYADVLTSQKLMREFERDVLQSRKMLEARPFYKKLDTKLEIGISSTGIKELNKKLKISTQAKEILEKALTSFIKGDIIKDRDDENKPSKDIVDEYPLSKLIEEHWDGLGKTVRNAKDDLDSLLFKYKQLHEWGLLDESINDEEMEDLRNPLRPKLFQSILYLLPKVLPELKTPFDLLLSSTTIEGENSNLIREYFRAFAKDRLAHVLVFQLSSLLFRPEIILKSIEFSRYELLSLINMNQKIYVITTGYLEYQSPYLLNSNPYLVKIIWKDNEFKAYMEALLSLLNKPDEFNQTYINDSRRVITIGSEKTIIWDPTPLGFERDTSIIRIIPPKKEDADLDYAFILYYQSLLENLKYMWSMKLNSSYPSSISILSRLISPIIRKP